MKKIAKAFNWFAEKTKIKSHETYRLKDGQRVARITVDRVLFKRKVVCHLYDGTKIPKMYYDCDIGSKSLGEAKMLAQRFVLTGSRQKPKGLYL